MSHGTFFLFLPIWYSASLLVLDRHLFPYIGNFSSMIMLKVLSVPLIWVSSVFQKLDVFIVFKSSCKFHSWVFQNWHFLWLNDPNILPCLQAWIFTSSWPNLLVSLSLNIFYLNYTLLMEMYTILVIVEVSTNRILIQQKNKCIIYLNYIIPGHLSRRLQAYILQRQYGFCSSVHNIQAMKPT